jgi:hypothetical protein
VRRWKCRSCLVVACLLAPLVALVACNGTHVAPYRSQVSGSRDAVPFVRVVEVELDRRFFTDPPDCVLVLPMAGASRQTPFSELVEKYLALHLGFRFGRVIYGVARDRMAARAGLDLTDQNDRKRFHEKVSCGYDVEFRMINAQLVFAVVWAQLSLGLEVRLNRARDGWVLWRARHTATRSDGGIAVSPLGALTSAVEATALASDGDQVVSLVADVTRRISATLPGANQGYENYCAGKQASFERLCNSHRMDFHRQARNSDRKLVPSRRYAYQSGSTAHR